MSFVGIMYNSNGLVGFADSRNTGIANGRQYFLDDETKQTFKAEDFLVVTWGTNTAMRGKRPVPLQGILADRLQGLNGTPHEFAEELKDELKDAFLSEPNIEYHFVFGVKPHTTKAACFPRGGARSHSQCTAACFRLAASARPTVEPKLRRKPWRQARQKALWQSQRAS